MDTKRKLLNFIVLVITFYSLLASCNDKPTITKCRADFIFEEPISIYPIKDTFQLGDTFYIEVNTSTTMHNFDYNWNSSYQKYYEYVDLKDHGILTGIALYQLSSNDSGGTIDALHFNGYNGAISPSGAKKFNYQTTKGKLTIVGDHQLTLDYSIEKDSFVHKTAIIVKDTGLFYFQFFDLLGYYYYGGTRNPDIIDTDCIQGWRLMRYTVNNSVTNSYLVENEDIKIKIADGLAGETQKYNFEHGSWSFVVVPKSTP